MALCYRHALVFHVRPRLPYGLDGGRRVRSPASVARSRTDGKVARGLLFKGRRRIRAPFHDSFDAPPDVGHGIDDQSHHQVCGVGYRGGRYRGEHLRCERVLLSLFLTEFAILGYVEPRCFGVATLGERACTVKRALKGALGREALSP